MPRVVSFSEAGGHPLNEDVFVVQRHPLDPDTWLCFVADGQGGRSGGGPAAELACRTALIAVTALPVSQLTDQPTWNGVLKEVDETVRDDAAAGFTTFVGLCVCGDRVVGASSGDSAALLVTDKEGIELTASQHKDPPVGSGSARAVPFTAKTGEGWQLLVMTDGVWKYAGWKPVVDAARHYRGSELIAELQRAARLPGTGRFQDDFTVVVLE